MVKDIHNWEEFQTFFNQDLEMNLKDSISKMGLILDDIDLQIDDNFLTTKVVNQANSLDPYLDYVVEIDSTGHFSNQVVPLDHEFIFIGRASNKKRLNQELKNLSMICYSCAKLIVLPQKDNIKNFSRTAYIHKSGNKINIYPTWLTVAGHENVYINQKKMASNSNSGLQGFETIQFCGEPPVKFLFIPSVQQSIFLSSEIEQILEKNQQWIYLGNYYKYYKKYSKALRYFSIAKQSITDLKMILKIEQEIHFLSNQMLMETNIEDHPQSPEFPSGWLEFSYFSEKYGGNIIKVEEEIQLYLQVVNQYQGQKIKRISINWKCDQVGNFNWRFYDINPRNPIQGLFQKKLYRSMLGIIL